MSERFDERISNDTVGSDEPIHLTAGGVSLVIGLDGWGFPVVLHWGAELHLSDLAGLARTGGGSVLNSAPDSPRSFSLLPSRAHGWSGTPALEWAASPGTASRLKFLGWNVNANHATFSFGDDKGSVFATVLIIMKSSGALTLTTQIRNSSPSAEVSVGAVRCLMPLPSRASEILDFTGRWSGERRPQRHRVSDGTWLRSSHRGRPGHDSAYLTAVGTPSFSFRTGEVWASHIAWSGNQDVLVERLPEGAGVHTSVIGAGESIEHSEIVLGPGQSYDSPEVGFIWGDRGLDSITERLHHSIREFSSHPTGPRPLVLNTWEAVYFDHDPERIEQLADIASKVGVERFVLDDGWFLGRRSDSAGLGDWVVDRTVWLGGLRPLSDHVHKLGMQFGLWFEPEMVNRDSELAREHPDWLLGELDDLTWRHQFALNLAHPAAFQTVLERISDLVDEAGLDFIKWDHNRDLHAAWNLETGRPAVHEQTLAAYRLIDELRRRHPHVEIESCASGGARPDLGMLSRTQRLWASDTNDPIERQMIQLWTQSLLPPELIGTHAGPSQAHTTGRVTDLDFRLLTSLFGHAGLEWDLTTCSEEELAKITAWSALYRELRPHLHSGFTVRGDFVDSGALLHGIVSENGGRGVYLWARTQTSATAHTARVSLPGLCDEYVYSVRLRTEIGSDTRHQVADPSWLRHAQSLELTGRVLSQVGLPLPLLNPGHALLLDVERLQ